MSEPGRIPRMMIFLMILVAVGVIILYFVGQARAQTAENVLHFSFDGGINRTMPNVALQTNEAVDLINFDITGKHIQKRWGYYKVGSSLYGELDKYTADSTLGLYGLKKRDGSQRLLRLAADSVNNWTDIWTGTLAAPLKTDAWLYRSGDYWFTTWKDYAYISDGYNFPWVTSGDTNTEQNHSLHIPAPGEMYVEILDDTSSSLDGKYRWAILSFPNCDTTTALCGGLTDTARARCLSRHVGYITPEVTVHHRKVALHLFWPNIADSGCAAPLQTKFYLCRTGTDKNRLGVSKDSTQSPDSLNIIQTVIDYPDSLSLTAAECLTEIIYDSGQAATDGFNLVHEYEKLYGGVRQALDSLVAPGAPRYFSRLTAASPTGPGSHTVCGLYMNDTTADYGLGQYAVTLLDTILNIESDTSRNLQLEYYCGDDSIITLAIPRVPTGMDNCIRRIYRGTRCINSDLCDTITALRLLGPIIGADTIFKDTFSAAGIDSNLSDHPIFVGKTHFRFNGTVAWDDRLYGWTGPYLYYSAKDTAKFGFLDFIGFSPDDGDAITVVVPDRNRLLVYKANSRHEVYEDASGDFSKTSPPYMVSGVGCIAPKSMQSWRGARVYLSRFGVVYEIGSSLQEKGNDIDTISMGIQPLLDAWTYSERSRAVGFIFDDNKYLLSIPGHDTTFVCFLDQPGMPWGIYVPFSFEDATLYEDDDDYVLTPPSEIVFGLAGDDRVFRWGDSLTDKGVAFTATYKSGRAMVTQKDAYITKSFLVREPGDTTGTLTITIYNQKGDSLGNYIVSDTATQFQHLGSINGNEAMGFQIKLVVADTGAGTNTERLKLEAMDVFYQLLEIDWR